MNLCFSLDTIKALFMSFLMLQCKEKMRPVKRALKMLESPEENMTEKDQVAQTRQVRFNVPKREQVVF